MTDDRARVIELNEDFYAAFERADLDGMEGVWATAELAPSVVCVHPGWPTLRGRDEVMRSWAMIMANTTYIQFVLTDIELEIAGEFAVLTCVENILTAADSGDADADDPGRPGNNAAFAGAKGVATNVFRRTPAGWRLWVRHGSPVIAKSPDSDDEN